MAKYNTCSAYFMLLMVGACYCVQMQEALIGDNVNATYFTQQYTDIQRYINSAITNGYKQIRISQGTYYMARSSLISTANVTIRGTEAMTTLLLNHTKASMLAMFVVSNTYNVSIADVMLNGFNNATGNMFEMNGVAFINTTHGSLENVRLINFRNGVFVNTSSHVNLISVHINSSQYDGLLVKQSSIVVVNSSSSSHNGRHGMSFINDNTFVSVSRSNIIDHIKDTSCGLNLEQSENVSVSDNMLLNNNVGICMKNIVSVKAVMNTITCSKETKCIYLNTVSLAEFINNQCNSKVIDPTTPSTKHMKLHKSNSVRVVVSGMVMIVSMVLSSMFLT